MSNGNRKKAEQGPLFVKNLDYGTVITSTIDSEGKMTVTFTDPAHGTKLMLETDLIVPGCLAISAEMCGILVSSLVPAMVEALLHKDRPDEWTVLLGERLSTMEKLDESIEGRRDG
jgi:hypothetical protein